MTLDGSASSDANGDLLNYIWTLTTRPAGSTAVLAGSTSASPTFTADLAGTYIASLVVNDGKASSTSSSVTVTATVANAAPVANAGNAQSVVTGMLITLDGAASSDANGDQLTYNWGMTTKPPGSAATLASATSAKPTFTADLAGTYVASLTVNDGKVSSTAATVTVTAAVANAAPVANAGSAQNVVTGTTVTLNGSASSDANGDALIFAWSLTSRPAGSAAALASATSAAPTFTADVAGTYVVSLAVNDGKVSSTAATVTVTAAVANVAPVANAGVAQNVVTGTLVTLDGSASSDANGDQLTYTWSLTSKPVGSTATLASATSARPTFTADAAGTYVASLTVNDGKVNSTAATVTVTAAVANVAPVANAGVAQSVDAGRTVTLNGSASSDANGDSLTYAWTLTGKPTGSAAALTASNTVSPTFVADIAGTFVASLIVNDGKVNSSTATVTIAVTDPKIIGVAYLARNDMTVTLVSFTTQDLGNGYTRYTATYKQANNTAVAIDEGSLKLFFSNATGEPQYGFFNRVLPGDAFAITRSYSWDVLSTSIPTVLMYDADGFFNATPVPGSLQWKFPIR